MTGPYDLLFRHGLARLDPERAHHLAFAVIRAVGIAAPVVLAVRARRGRPTTDVLGLRFPGPFGVAAGFDKDARGVAGLAALGFGHVEVGTVTPRAQPGNPRPRLFRLVADRAVVNRMGFNNGGAPAAARRLAALPASVPRHVVVGANIGKNKDTPLDDAVADYAAGARTMAPVADYLAVNVSSPNTPGLRGLQELDALEPVLRAVREAAGATPVLVKIAPDLDDEQLRGVAALAVRVGLDGIIATNTTVSRSGLRTPAAVVEAAGAGGLSGAPLAMRSLEALRVLRGAVPAGFCIVSAGGVSTGSDVAARLADGADLVQGYTGFLYRGPLWAAHIAREIGRASR